MSMVTFKFLKPTLQLFSLNSKWLAIEGTCLSFDVLNNDARIIQVIYDLYLSLRVQIMQKYVIKTCAAIAY